MADTTSRIRILFDGAVDGLRRAVRQAESDLDRLNDGLERNREHLETFNRVGDGVGRTVATMSKAFLGLGAASGSIQGVVAAASTLATVTTQLAPAALALPGIFLGIGVAVGTAKLALLGVADAIKGDAEALAKLSPAARDSVGAIRGLEAGFNKLKAAVQEDFFAGLAIEIKQTGAALLDVGQKSLPNVASGFNAMAVEALRAARTPFFTGALTQIIDNTGTALFNMKGTLANVLTGFVGLGTVGSKFLPAIGKAIDDVARKFNDWVQKGINDKSIERMIDRAIEGFKTLGRILSDVGDTFSVVLSAFNKGLGGSGGTLESIERITSAFEELASSGNVQSALTALGETVRVLGDAFRTVLTAAVQEFGPVIRDIAPFVQELARQIGNALVAAIKTVGPILQGLARFLSDNKEQIAALAPLLIPLALGFKAVGAAIATVKGLAALSAAFTALRAALAGGLAARLLAMAGAIGRFLWPVAAFAGVALFATYINEINKAAVGGDPEKLGDMAQTLNDLIEAGKQLASGDLPGIMREIGEEWQQLVDKFVAGESPAGAAFAKIRESFQRDVIDFFGPAVIKIKDSFQRDFLDVFANLPAQLGEVFAKIRDSFQRDFLDFFANLPAKVGEIFEGLRSAVATKLAEVTLAIANFFRNPAGAGFDIGAAVGQMIINFLNGFTTLATQTKAKLDETTAAIRNWATVQVPAAVAGLAARLILTAVQAWQGFLTSTTQKLAEIVAFVSQLPARIGAALAGLVGTLIKVALDAWNSFFGQTKSGGDRSVSETRTVPGKMGSALSALPGILVQAATAAFNGFVSACQAGINRAIAVVRTLPGLVASAVGNLGGTLVSAGAALISGFIRGIESMIPGIRAAAGRAMAAAAGFIPNSPAKEGPFSGRGYTLYRGQILVDDFVTGIRSSIPAAAAAAAALTRATSGALNPSIQLGALEAAQLARAQAQSAARGLLGTAVNQVTAVATREQPAPVTNVTVLLSREQISEIARVVVEDSNRETARRVTAGSGITF